jgi:hypothetical protein
MPDRVKLQWMKTQTLTDGINSSLVVVTPSSMANVQMDNNLTENVCKNWSVLAWV